MLLVPSATSLAQDDILLYGGNQDIENIDPATGENYSINGALRSLYDALYIYRASDTIPHLVDSYEVNDDATVWTFHLKENAVFHDGSPVNADAVVYSFNRNSGDFRPAELALVHHCRRKHGSGGWRILRAIHLD